MANPIDMPARPASFAERGGWLVRRLAHEFSLSLEQAAGLVGNLGYESDGFEKLHEVGQPEGVGGYGWGQWTAARRRTFLAYAEQFGLDWR
ncbi:MAG: phage tail tip lysozyme, partial [Rhodospirillaceae bacterium]